MKTPGSENQMQPEKAVARAGSSPKTPTARKPKKHKPKAKEPTASELAMDAYSTLRTWVNKWLMDRGFEINDYDDDDDEMLESAPEDLQHVLGVLSKLIAVLS